MNNAPPAILSGDDACSPVSIPATKQALLLLDFHSFICASQPGGGQAPIAQAVELRQWAKAQGMMIVHCCIDLKAITPAHRKMSSRANGIRDKMSHASPSTIGEPECIAASADEYTFWRPPSHVSALGSYGLRDFLRHYGIESLILAGFSTSGCVINTAKGAADEGYVVTVVRDACGDKNQAVHDMVMDTLLIGQCHVTDRKSLIEAFADAGVATPAANGIEKLSLS
ncbi:hypothetical protein ANO11243_075950 [Dothideomycetidae sp. 11243]|nr:hypothetical protein ANO11243_075950 [fungal sp. No.11243]